MRNKKLQATVKLRIAEKLADRCNMSVSQAIIVLNEFQEIVAESLSEGRDVIMRGFVRFYMTKRKARKARNINAGMIVEVPEKWIPDVKFTKPFIASIKEKKRKNDGDTFEWA